MSLHILVYLVSQYIYPTIPKGNHLFLAFLYDYFSSYPPVNVIQHHYIIIINCVIIVQLCIFFAKILDQQVCKRMFFGYSHKQHNQTHNPYCAQGN